MNTTSCPASSAPSPVILFGSKRDECGEHPWFGPWVGSDDDLYQIMISRFYGNNIGRFLKPDNIITSITNPQGWNRYNYVLGNPVNLSDPWGHAPVWQGQQIKFAAGGWTGASGTIGGPASWTTKSHDIVKLQQILGIVFSLASKGTETGNSNGKFGGPSLNGLGIGNMFSFGQGVINLGRWAFGGFTPSYGFATSESEYTIMGGTPIWEWASERSQETISPAYFLTGKIISADILEKTSVIGHRGVWREIGQAKVKLPSYGKGRAAEIGTVITCQLLEITEIFEYEGLLGLARYDQMWADVGNTERTVSFWDWQLEFFPNPYDYPNLGLGDEPLGQPVRPGSIFLGWVQY